MKFGDTIHHLSRATGGKSHPIHLATYPPGLMILDIKGALLFQPRLHACVTWLKPSIPPGAQTDVYFTRTVQGSGVLADSYD
ncbi:hypothetical protein BDV35DRAFT_104362 [Aspergillus flavus]|uniref:Uncharacterized protein n=1 Tax=Aspergillus flavus TaxID=5059 RepID=A0A5N6GH87_ASPFL|nr:hypothetical protein BDV35DRAFT_104362 [Aspergillus flavus]